MLEFLRMEFELAGGDGMVHLALVSRAGAGEQWRVLGSVRALQLADAVGRVMVCTFTGTKVVVERIQHHFENE